LTDGSRSTRPEAPPQAYALLRAIIDRRWKQTNIISKTIHNDTNQYKAILKSELGQASYDKNFSSLDQASLGPLNSNLPKYNKKYNVNVDGNNISVFKEFWHYKQPGGTIFTDWNSAGLSALKEDMSVRDLPLYGHINNPTLVLSNTNNVRNNFQNYGKEYLTTTNMLNSEAFLNGVSYESGYVRVSVKGISNRLYQINKMIKVSAPNEFNRDDYWYKRVLIDNQIDRINLLFRFNNNNCI
jgi:hypothetical protein